MEDYLNSEAAPKGAFSALAGGQRLAPLVSGKRCRVVKACIDVDTQVHPVGEEWIYLGTAFLPYGDGRSLFVSFDGEREWPMQEREEEQRAILNTLCDDRVATAELAEHCLRFRAEAGG